MFAAGGTHACAMLHNDSSVRCWGYNLNNNWVLGVQNSPLYNPSVVPPLALVTSGATPATVMVATFSSLHTCILLSTGGVRCWGTNAFGQVWAALAWHVP